MSEVINALTGTGQVPVDERPWLPTVRVRRVDGVYEGKGRCGKDLMALSEPVRGVCRRPAQKAGADCSAAWLW